jgi:hypothetical protein
MGCTNCVHSFVCTILQNGGYRQDCKCFLDKDLVIKFPCPVGSTIYIHAYNRETNKYEVTPIKNIQLSELAVLIEDNEPIYLDENSANDALGDRNNK